jgi:predicted MFS family arabinose efflux permease
MQLEKQAKGKTITLITLIVAGESVFFLPFVLARVFRPTLLDLFAISNTELGLWFSLYGVVAMISYLLGGPLADRFPARNLMAYALWLTSAGGVLMSLVPSSRIMLWLYAFWGFTTICLFWAAMIRATREWGGTDFFSD